MLSNPLEQFEVLPFLVLEGRFLDLTISNFTLFLFFNFLTIGLLLTLASYRLQLVPTPFQLVVEELYAFVLDTLRQQAGTQGLRYFVYYFLIFLFILTANVTGLIPFCFTTTSHIIMVSFLALVSNLAFVFIGVKEKGILEFLSHFVPAGAPKALIPLITVIEVVSYLIRTFSLSLRLFANMMAGHILLFILATFFLKIAVFVPFGYGVYAFIMLMVMLAVYTLEAGICFIQAYVFLVLLTIYLDESLPHGHSDEHS
jgi:F-type H+-transporting ATPase subunit a